MPPRENHPLLRLRPLTQAEFPGYLSYFLPDYAAEITASYGLSPDQAKAQAARELASDLPQGPDTSGQTLLSIDLGERPVGYIWLAETPPTAFVNDVHVFPADQGHGLGTAALALMETRLTALGITQIRLRVAASNPRAERLYRALGFRATGVNMMKPLRPGP